eukprot:scaffold188271_cov17-Tisochrysis_lutea.AAC.2
MEVPGCVLMRQDLKMHADGMFGLNKAEICESCHSMSGIQPFIHHHESRLQARCPLLLARHS